MKAKTVTIPELILIAGTRVALGAGIGLLISDRLSRDKKRGAGWALVGFGVVTTIPIVMEIAGKRTVDSRASLAA